MESGVPLSRGFPGRFSDYDFRAKIGGGAFRIAGNSPGSDRAGAGPNITVEGSKSFVVMPDGTALEAKVAVVKRQGSSDDGVLVYRERPSDDWKEVPVGAKIYRGNAPAYEVGAQAIPKEDRTPDYSPHGGSEAPKSAARVEPPKVAPQSDGGQVSPADPSLGQCETPAKILISENADSASIGSAESGLARCDHSHALAPSDIAGVFISSPTIEKSFAGGQISFSLKDGIIPDVPECGSSVSALDGAPDPGTCLRYASSDHKHAVDLDAVMSANGFERQTIQYVKNVRLGDGGLIIEYGAVAGYFEEGTDQPDDSVIETTDCEE